jgi:two-component system nitrate/nitrite response regulator NarL
LGPLRILIADDHGPYRRLLVRLLGEEPDMEVVGDVGDGRAVLELVEGLDPHLVLLDLWMPSLDGAATTGQLKQVMPDLRILGISHDEDSDLADQARRNGAERVVSKTISHESLLALIRGTPADR